MLPNVKHLGEHHGKVAFNCPHCGEPLVALAFLSANDFVSCDECHRKFRIDPDALLQWEMLHREVRNAG